MAPSKKKKVAKMAVKKPAKKGNVKKAQKSASKKPVMKVTAKKATKKLSKLVPRKAAKTKVPITKTNKMDWSNLFTPLDDRIVVRVAEAPKSVGRIIIPFTTETPHQGVVLAVGRGHQNKKGKLKPMDVKAGDEILFSPHSGTTMQIQGTEVLILREADVLGVLNS